MTLLHIRERAVRHPAVTRIVSFIFLAWLFLFTLSSWIDLFQGFEVTEVLVEYVRGITLGLISGLLLGVPVWLILTQVAERFLTDESSTGPYRYSDQESLAGSPRSAAPSEGGVAESSGSGSASVWDDDF